MRKIENLILIGNLPDFLANTFCRLRDFYKSKNIDILFSFNSKLMLQEMVNTIYYFENLLFKETYV